MSRARSFTGLGGNDVKTLVSIVVTLGFFAAATAYAAAPASAPAGTTGQCKDGTFTAAAAKKGACHGHQGVKEWYAADTAAATTTSNKSTTAASTSSSKKKPADTSTASSSTTGAATPVGPKPADATGLCNDGTYYTGENKKGACRGHKGVKDWYGASTVSKTTAATPSATPAPAKMPAQTYPKSTPTTMPNASTPTTGTATGSKGTMPGATTPTAMPAAGGGAGKVWVNSESKVYHCQGDRYYGTTKHGEYMSEADAAAKGNRPAHGKSCSS
jgi:hypothetical protein